MLELLLCSSLTILPDFLWRRYGQGKLMRERFIPRVMEAPAETLLDDIGHNLDPHRIWATMFTNEKPGGHGERSVAIGTIDMAVWDAVAKIEEKPLFRLLAERHGNGQPDPRVFVYAAGGYYYPGKDDGQLKDEMRSYLDRGYSVVKMKIGGASLFEDLRRIAGYGVMSTPAVVVGEKSATRGASREGLGSGASGIESFLAGPWSFQMDIGRDSGGWPPTIAPAAGPCCDLAHQNTDKSATWMRYPKWKLADRQCNSG